MGDHLSCKSAKILSLEEAKKMREHSCDSPKWIYDSDSQEKYRYILGTVGTNPLIVIGVNPSTADPNYPDNTIRAVKRRIERHKEYDSFIMFNLYAQRVTNPNAMDYSFNEKLHEKNKKEFRRLLEYIGQDITIWAAWGTLIEKRKYLKKCLQDIVSKTEKSNVKWVKIGKLSKAGHPHHPLYLPENLDFEEFDIEQYIKTL